jgi:hypothetical protein
VILRNEWASQQKYPSEGEHFQVDILDTEMAVALARLLQYGVSQKMFRFTRNEASQCAISRIQNCFISDMRILGGKKKLDPKEKRKKRTVTGREGP